MLIDPGEIEPIDAYSTRRFGRYDVVVDSIE